MEFVDDQKSKTRRVDLFKANSKLREEAKQEEEEWVQLLHNLAPQESP